MPNRQQLTEQAKQVVAAINKQRFYILAVLILALLTYAIFYIGQVLGVQPDEATKQQRLGELTKTSVQLDRPIIDEIRARQQQTTTIKQPSIGDNPFGG